MSNYFIKRGYVPNNENYTLDINREEPYWSKTRILMSNYFQWDVYKYADEIIKLHKINTVLDLGCGNGAKLARVIVKNPYVKRIIGIDQKNAIKYCRENCSFGEFYEDDFENPNITKLEGKVGMIICSDVIEHLANPDKLLCMIKTISDKDTMILFSTPERDLMRGKECLYSPQKEHVREWNGYEFRRYLRSSGFEILEHRTVFPLRFSIYTLVHYCKIFIGQYRMGLSAKYVQVVLCKPPKYM